MSRTFPFSTAPNVTPCFTAMLLLAFRDVQLVMEDDLMEEFDSGGEYRKLKEA